jgi:hypothetical protein
MPKIVCLDPVGTPYAPRWRLTDNEGNYWNAKGWTKQPKEAGLFIDSESAGQQLRTVMLEQVPGKLSTFSVPFIIEVKSDNPIRPDELLDWLAKNLQIQFRDMSINGSMILLKFDWEGIKENE